MKAMTKDGRSVRAQNIYDEAHEKLVDSAIELFNCLLYTSDAADD